MIIEHSFVSSQNMTTANIIEENINLGVYLQFQMYGSLPHGGK